MSAVTGPYCCNVKSEMHTIYSAIIMIAEEIGEQLNEAPWNPNEASIDVMAHRSKVLHELCEMLGARIEKARDEEVEEVEKEAA